jgi:SulP family sulfate permease
VLDFCRLVLGQCGIGHWINSASAQTDKVVIKFRREGAEVDVLGLNEASATIFDRFGVHEKPDAIDKLVSH